ncbi:hypothetical protein Tco_1336322, partial [Tanacetum coccineum]
MARQCTKPKRPRNPTRFKDKAMLAEALESGMSLEISTLAAFQTDDLDAFDYDCDEAPSESVVLMAKLSSYDLYILLEHAALSVIDTEETLKLAEESRLKMHAKQNDLIVTCILVTYFKTCSEILPVQPEPVLKEIPRELPTISLVKDSFNKTRNHVNDFENVVTVRTKYFHMFDQGLHIEITDMKEVFAQMETDVAKCSVQRKTFEIKEKELLLKNERLLELLISQDIVHITVNSLAEFIDYQSMQKSFLDEYSECVELKAEPMKWLKRLFMMNFQNDVPEWKID